MELIPRFLLALARLATLERPAQLAVEPLPALLGGMPVPAASGEAAAAFAQGDWRQAPAQLARALVPALRDPTAHRRLTELAAAAETLLVAAGATAEPSLRGVQLRLERPALFHLLRLLRLTPPAASPQLFLVGALAASGASIELPLGLAAPLDGLAVGYSPAAPTPSWRSELWLRVPPDPNRRRLADWPADLLATARRIELYRQRLPGSGPEAVILTEPVSLPHQLTAGHVSVELLDQGARLRALRSTVLDKFQAPLVVIERMLPQH